VGATEELNRSLDFENAEALTENPQQKNRRRWKSKLDSEDWYTRCARLYDTSFWIAKLSDGRLKRVDKYELTKAGVRWVNHCLGLNWDKQPVILVHSTSHFVVSNRRKSQ